MVEYAQKFAPIETFLYNNEPLMCRFKGPPSIVPTTWVGIACDEDGHFIRWILAPCSSEVLLKWREGKIFTRDLYNDLTFVLDVDKSTGNFSRKGFVPQGTLSLDPECFPVSNALYPGLTDVRTTPAGSN